MTTYDELAQAFVVAGLLSQSNVGAAAGILADTLVIGEAKDAAAAAVADMYSQEETKQKNALWTDADVAAGNWDAVDEDAAIIAEAEEKQAADQAAVAAAEDRIAATFADATDALIAAKLVNEADYDAALSLIKDIWIADAS